jgi:hypothetical protein
VAGTKNTIKDLRDHLFETLEMLKDTEKPMELDRARAINEVAQVIINTAKVEVDLVKAVSGSAPGSSAFFNLPDESRDPRGTPRLIERRQASPLPREGNGDR